MPGKETARRRAKGLDEREKEDVTPAEETPEPGTSRGASIPACSQERGALLPVSLLPPAPAPQPLLWPGDQRLGSSEGCQLVWGTLGPSRSPPADPGGNHAG